MLDIMGRSEGRQLKIEIEDPPIPTMTRKMSTIEAMAVVEENKKTEIAKSWSKEQEGILKIWAEKAAGYRWLHEHSCRHYRRLNNRFVYPQILLSTLAGVGGFSITSSSQTDNFTILGYMIAALNVIVAILSSFQKFIMAAEKSEIHATVGRQFAAFYRNVVLELSLNPSDRENCLEFCKMCRAEYDRLMTVAPNVPAKIIDQFKVKFSDVTYKPDIANGLSDMQIWERTQEEKVEDAFVKMRAFYKMIYRTKAFCKTPQTEKNLPV